MNTVDKMASLPTDNTAAIYVHTLDSIRQNFCCFHLQRGMPSSLPKQISNLPAPTEGLSMFAKNNKS